MIDNKHLSDIINPWLGLLIIETDKFVRFPRRRDEEATPRGLPKVTFEFVSGVKASVLSRK